MKICFEPSPVCPVIPFPLFMKFRLHFCVLCPMFLFPVRMAQHEWQPTSANSRQHSTPPSKWEGPLSHQGNGPTAATEHSAVRAVRLLWSYCSAVVPWCRQHSWAARGMSATTAESPTSAGHCPLLGAGRCPTPKPPQPPPLMLRDKDVIMHPLEKGGNCPLTRFHCC